MKAMILAAGEGTRLRPLTLERPKPMLPVGGRPLLEHLIHLLRHHGVRQIGINLNYKPEVIVEYFGDGSRFGVQLTYSSEERLLGTAGGVKQLEWFFDQPFFVLYGDLLTDLDLAELNARHRASGALASIALYRVQDPTRCGIVQLGPGGRIVRFVEKPPTEAGLGNLANAGVYVLEPEVLRFVPDGQPYDFGLDLFPELLARGLPLYGWPTEAYVLDIGSPERYAQAEADWQAGRYPPAGQPADPGVPRC